ncbi:hypothetical protein A605_10300 [Corynebacterium halotolerans YIM 70093 = DSM 44683]|uniref:HTH cro/C1-type domain-containing protein n=2 Tax=Corynebacterium halotolerans TaxID=225326 RepID=M1NZY0_9CORY|nr:hypothetical protein A605_10300 [Corynebacterium halotolerans YIM 70093 = DSM 44683]
MVEPSGLTQYRLAQDLGVSQSLVSRLMTGHARITAGLALRLSAYFGDSAEFWLNLQQNYDLAEARATVDTSGIPHFSATG